MERVLQNIKMTKIMENVANKEQKSSQGVVLFVVLTVVFVACLTMGILHAAKII